MRHILIIDSNISFSVSIKRAMETTEQYKVRTVTRLSPALDALQNGHYDLAVVDTQISFSTIEEVIPALQAQAPNLPIIISSPNEVDRLLVKRLKAQGFVSKPFVARMLIPIIEETLARGVAPDTAPQSLAQELVDQEKQELLEPMLEATRRTAATLMTEPPRSADDSTISEILDQALRPEVSQRIYAAIDPEPMPNDASLSLENRPPLEMIPEAPIVPENAATDALAMTQDVANLDDLLEQIRRFANGQASGRAYEPLSPMLNPLGASPLQFAHEVPPPPTTPLPVIDPTFEPRPSAEDTYLTHIPRPPRLPDHQWFEMADEPTAHLELPDVPQKDRTAQTVIADPSEITLIPTTLDQMTEQLEAVEAEIIEEQVAQDAEALRLPEQALAHYAAHLTRFALESAAKGIMITRGLLRLAQAGELEISAWDQLTQLVLENWAQEGDSRTRVLYRRLDIGEILIYSIQTVQELTLTLIFSADTPLKVIRRQATQLTEALLSQPLPSEELLYTQPVLVIPSDLQEGQEAALASAPVLPIESAAPEMPIRLERAVGTYASYACVWLVENTRNAINPTAARMIEGWIMELCQANDWDFESAHIEREWLYVVVAVPVGTLPSVVAATLMDGTAQQALALDPRQSSESPWGSGYLIRTPPASLHEQHIQRFIQFYRSTKVSS